MKYSFIIVLTMLLITIGCKSNNSDKCPDSFMDGMRGGMIIGAECSTKGIQSMLTGASSEGAVEITQG